tara:strand:+ start:2151 stop:2360 length:210 start_codon:yes stop_codon:yes gene_type:complete
LQIIAIGYVRTHFKVKGYFNLGLIIFRDEFVRFFCERRRTLAELVNLIQWSCGRASDNEQAGEDDNYFA